MSGLSIDVPEAVIEQVVQRAVELLVERQNGVAPERWLDVRGAAEHLGISVSQLYTLTSQRHRNGLPVVKEGSRSYFKASALDAWREAGRSA